MKFAQRRVAGWKHRHGNLTDVMNKLNTRMNSGFTLTAEERQYYDDTDSLFKLYNPKAKCPW